MTHDLALELALDRIEAVLAAELPAHVLAFARAHAAGRPPPPAPAILVEPATVAAALAAKDAPRGRRLYRQCALAAIEHAVTREPGVSRVTPSYGGSGFAVAGALPREGGWPALVALARARDEVAHRRFGRSFLAVAHDVYEVPAVVAAAPSIGRLAPVPAPPITPRSVADLWRRLGGDQPPPEIVLSAARSRAFRVRPGHVVVVIRAEPTVAAWSAAAHELGHALAPEDLARTADEAFAIATARRLEAVFPALAADLAALHARQHAIAAELAAVEAALYAGAPVDDARPAAWALFHDPGAQAAYAAAHACVTMPACP
jgi:hypothetical protein